MTDKITPARQTQLAASGFTVSCSDWIDGETPRRTWFYSGAEGTRSDLDYDTEAAAWRAASEDHAAPPILIEVEHFDDDPDGDEDRAGDGYYFRVIGEIGWSGAWDSEEEALEMARDDHGPRVELGGVTDDGCPKGDPECLADNGDNHDACTTAAERERAETHSVLCSIHDGGRCTCDGDLDWAPEDEADEVEAFAYPSPGDRVTTDDGPRVVFSLGNDRPAGVAPRVALVEDAQTDGDPRWTEAAFLIRTGPSSWRERLPRAGTVGGAAPAQVLEVGDVFHGVPLPAEPLPMEWRDDISDHAGGHALVIVADADAGRSESWVLDVLFSDRAQGEVLRPMIQEAAQRIMMQAPEALDLTPGSESYALRFPLEHKATATRAYSDGFSDGTMDVSLADLLEQAEIDTILAALRYYQENGQGDPANRSDDLHDLATRGGESISLDSDGIDDLCERINTDSPRAELISPPTVYIVQGDHWSTPGRPMFVLPTEELANAKAAELVNGMLEELELSPCWPDTDWKEGLARVKAEVQASYGEADAVEVWIDEKAVQS